MAVSGEFPVADTIRIARRLVPAPSTSTVAIQMLRLLQPVRLMSRRAISAKTSTGVSFWACDCGRHRYESWEKKCLVENVENVENVGPSRPPV
jgi:hypothetical protein